MNDPKVDDYVSKLTPKDRDLVNALRQLVPGIDPEIREQIKWNSCSFFYGGTMKDFDPKEYKRDLLVVNLHRGKYLLVFPTGNQIPDELLKGTNYPDGRKIVPLETPEALPGISESLKAGIRYWLNQIE